LNHAALQETNNVEKGDVFSRQPKSDNAHSYARVSTDNKGQDPENQLRQLREWCANAGHELVQEYVDRESDRKGANGHKHFAALFEDAHKRKFDCVLFWPLDRFTHEGMAPTIMHLQRLASCGVGFHSYTEPHLATDNELVRDILLALLASLAKQEQADIRACQSWHGSSQGAGQAGWQASDTVETKAADRRANRGRRDSLCRCQDPRDR
jgi:DNA invertase Pin-like site-specific DNA recombinase